MEEVKYEKAKKSLENFGEQAKYLITDASCKVKEGVECAYENLANQCQKNKDVLILIGVAALAVMIYIGVFIATRDEKDSNIQQILENYAGQVKDSICDASCKIKDEVVCAYENTKESLGKFEVQASIADASCKVKEEVVCAYENTKESLEKFGEQAKCSITDASCKVRDEVVCAYEQFCEGCKNNKNILLRLGLGVAVVAVIIAIGIYKEELV